MERTHYKESFQELCITTEKQYIHLYGEAGIGKNHLLNDMKDDGFFTDENASWVDCSYLGSLSEQIIENTEVEYMLFTHTEKIDFSEIRTFIESQSINSKVIFTSEIELSDPSVANFELPGVSFREFTEQRWLPITVWSLFQGEVDIKKGNESLSDYLHCGHIPRHIENDLSISDDFSKKCTIMKQELFKKEEWELMEFMRTLAMNTGNLFKADQIAKLLGISRRKVHKYTELLMKHHCIRAIAPWSENSTTETTRHVKVYFSDLSFLASLLGDLHFQGSMKQWALENFIFLELARKLEHTHRIYFYRKKSGAEISFLLENRENTLLTPIEVNVRETQAISQALTTFDSSYHERIEHSMLTNESLYGKKDLHGKPVIIIPHIAI